MGNEPIYLEQAKKLIENIKTEAFRIPYLMLSSLQIVTAQKGSMLCRCILPREFADRTGNCHVGAIASLIDVVGATAITIYTGDFQVSVNLDVSYFATVKIEEEVEIEAKVVAHRGKLSSTTVEFRRKKNAEVIALGKLWFSQVNAIPGFRTRL